MKFLTVTIRKAATKPSPRLVELGTAAKLTLGQGAGSSESKRYIYNSSISA